MGIRPSTLFKWLTIGWGIAIFIFFGWILALAIELDEFMGPAKYDRILMAFLLSLIPLLIFAWLARKLR